MKHIQIFEEFKEGPMEKEPNIFQKALKGARNFFGMESEEDRKAVDKIADVIIRSPEFVSNTRIIKPGVIVSYIVNKTITIDTIDPQIRYNGKILDLYNVGDEANYLYDLLKSKI